MYVTRSQTQVLRLFQDLTRGDATYLMMLVGASARSNLTVHRVRQDSSSVMAEGGATAWQAEQITTLSRSPTAVVVGRDHRAWRDDGTSWAPFLSGVTAAAFPG